MKQYSHNGQTYRLANDLTPFQFDMQVHLTDWKWRHLKTRDCGLYKGVDVSQFVLGKVGPMLHGLFPAREQPLLLEPSTALVSETVLLEATVGLVGDGHLDQARVQQTFDLFVQLARYGTVPKILG